MKKSIFRMVMMVSMIAGASIMANGQHHKGARDNDNPSKQREFRKMNKEGHRGIPDLTDEQKEKVKELKVSFMKDTSPIENELNEKSARLNTLTSSESIDKKAIEKVIKEIGELKTKLMLAREFHKQDVRAILTEEQRVFFDRKGNHKRGKRHGR